MWQQFDIHTQIALGLGDPNMGSVPQLEYVMKGSKRQTTGHTAQKRLLITTEILCCLKHVWQTWPNQCDAVILWAAMCTCFFGFLPSGEVLVPLEAEFDLSVHLCYGDVKVDSTDQPCVLEVRIKAFKNRSFSQGGLGISGEW